MVAFTQRRLQPPECIGIPVCHNARPWLNLLIGGLLRHPPTRISPAQPGMQWLTSIMHNTLFSARGIIAIASILLRRWAPMVSFIWCCD